MAEDILEKYRKMAEGLTREEIRQRAIKAMRELQAESERNGVSNMTLEEINAEIYAARREMERRETEAMLQ